MTNKYIKFLFVVLAFFMLSACDPAEDEAKKLGFDDVQDMRSKHAQGWHTKAQFYEDNYKHNGFANAIAMKTANDNAIVERAKQAEVNKDTEAKQAKENEKQTTKPSTVESKIPETQRKELDAYGQCYGAAIMALGTGVKFDEFDPKTQAEVKKIMAMTVTSEMEKFFPAFDKCFGNKDENFDKCITVFGDEKNIIMAKGFYDGRVKNFGMSQKGGAGSARMHASLICLN